MAVRQTQPFKPRAILILTALFLGILAFAYYFSGRPGGPANPGAGTPAFVKQQMEAYQQVLAHDPQNVEALVGLGNMYYDSNQWLKAADYYQQALKAKPDLDDVRTDLGTSYFNMGLNPVAEGEFRKVLKRNPRHINAAFNLGVVLHASGRMKEANAVWKNILPHAPPQVAQRIKKLLQGADS